jgi:flagellar assembly factor FliW
MSSTLVFQTVHFGRIDVDEDSMIEFPEGLPGFEARRRFALLQDPAYGPLVFLQSLELAGLCLPALPVGAVRSDYSLAVMPEDLEKLGLPQDRQPVIGRDVAALAIVCLPQGEPPTANLLSPVLIHLKTRRALQAIRLDRLYTCSERLAAGEAACS